MGYNTKLSSVDALGKNGSYKKYMLSLSPFQCCKKCLGNSHTTPNYMVGLPQINGTLATPENLEPV